MSKIYFSLFPIACTALLAGCQPGGNSAAQTGAASRRDPADARRVYDLPDTVPNAVPDTRSDPNALAAGSQAYADQLNAAAARRANPRSRVRADALPSDAAPPPDAAPAAARPPVPSAVQFQDPQRPAAPVADPAAGLAALPPAAAPAPAAIPAAAVVTPTLSVTPARAEVAFNKDTPAVNTPLLVAQPRPLPSTDDLARRFAQQSKDFPQDMAAQLNWQLLQFLQGQSVPDQRALAGLPSEDQEVLSTVMDGLSNFRNAVQVDGNMLLSRKIHPWLEVSDHLRTQAELTIPTIALCTDVKGFGVYDPIEPARFEAGKERRVIVYCEVENFASNLDDQKRWTTKLTQEVVLYTEQGGVEVWRDKTPARPIIDYSRNRRHDFFIVKMIRLPANLTIDRYLLKVTVVDQQVNRVAENTVPVQIVAQP